MSGGIRTTLDAVASTGCKASVTCYAPTSSHGGMSQLSDFTPDGWVRATDYAALQAKLDAVTKDAERYRAGLAEAYEWLFESMSDGPRVSEGAIEKDYYTPEFKALHTRMSAALTDQGRAGEGRSDG